MSWVFRPFIVFFALLLPLPLGAVIMSSKAVRSALRSQKAINEGNTAGIETAVATLEGLLSDPSFKRLDTKAQLEIILLLSKGYGRLLHFPEQEQLLLRYSKRAEFHRHYIPLMTELVHVYATQERFEEAEKIIAKIAQPSCCHLSLEEKSLIGNAINFKDNYLRSLFERAGNLTSSGDFSRAYDAYKRAYPSVKRHKYPHQGSSLERRRLHCKILLNMAELQFCLCNFEETITILSNEDLFSSSDTLDETFSRRRLFLLASAHGFLHNVETATSLWEQYAMTSHDKENDLAVSLWKTSRALTLGDSQVFLQHAKHIENQAEGNTDGLLEGAAFVVLGIQRAINLDSIDASLYLKKGIQKLQTTQSPWKEAALALYGELAWQRCVLFLYSQQEQMALSLSKESFDILSQATSPTTIARRCCFAFLLNPQQPPDLSYETLKVEIESTTQETSSARLLASLRLYGKEHHSEAPQNCLAADQLFFAWHTRSSDTFEWTGEPIDCSAIISAPLLSYTKIMSSVHSALLDEADTDVTIAQIVSALNAKCLTDARPRLLQALVELCLHAGRLSEACDFVRELIHQSPSFPGVPQTVFLCLQSLETASGFDAECSELCQYFWDRPPDRHALLLTTHLFESRQQLVVDKHPSIKSLGLSLVALSEARTAVAEASKSKEPAAVKSQLDLAKKNYELSHRYAREALSLLEAPETTSFLYGFLLTMQNEHVEVLSNYLPTDCAFNELPSQLEEAKRVLLEDLSLLHTNVSSWTTYLRKEFVLSCSLTARTVDVYVKAFQGAPLDAVAAAEQLIQEAPQALAVLKGTLYLAKKLREAAVFRSALFILDRCDEAKILDPHYELSLEFAMEKSLCLRALSEPSKAMAKLAWIINRPYPSSLRVKAMILRADMYLEQHRTDLAIRQLESVATKGGEWKVVAERKLQELYGTV